MPRGDGTGPRGQGPVTGRGLEEDRAGAEAEEEVLRQVLMGTVFAQTVVRECLTKWGLPAMSRNAISVGAL